MKDWSDLANAWKETWNAMRPDERARVEPDIRANHEALLSIRAGVAPPSPPKRELVLVHSLLHDDPDGLLDDAVTGNPETWVGPDGEVFFGGVDYDSTDPGWAYCPLAWRYTDGKQPPFAAAPATIPIADTVTIALLGDWGGGNDAAKKVAVSVRAKLVPGDIVVHLGDVYYAGTNESGIIERDYQRKNFLGPWPWPKARGRSFALNSNHDMYAHGAGYFNSALTSSDFSSQSRCSYFALYNDSFRVIGLDSAYFAPDRSGEGFMEGRLGPTGPGTQAEFLHAQAQAAAGAGQQLILFTHHNALARDASTTLPLWEEVMAQLTPFTGGRVIWYWGHAHMGVVYPDREAAGITISPRCCGHGCIPWGLASELNTPSVEWYEKKLRGPGSNYFVTNGFSTIALKGAAISETFFREDGTRSWGN